MYIKLRQKHLSSDSNTEQTKGNKQASCFVEHRGYRKARKSWTGSRSNAKPFLGNEEKRMRKTNILFLFKNI